MNNTIINYCKIIFTYIGGILAWISGGFDSLIYALIAFVAIDYITGVLLAIHNKKLSSNIGFRGITKKILIFMIISMGNIIDKYILGTGDTIRTLVIIFYFVNEGISILENAGLLGLPIPKKLRDILLKLNSDDK